MTPDAIEDAARRLIAGRDAVATIERLPDGLRPSSEAEGYAIQDAAIRLRAEAGFAIAGWKIGCTSATMQRMLGVDGPCAGAVLARDLLQSPARVKREAAVKPVAECEIALRLASDVPPRAGGHDATSIAPHVGACMTAIELADFRYPEPRPSPAELIADDFFQRAVVLGPELSGWQGLDLATLRATTRISGKLRGEGVGRDALGHPLSALAWLADRLAGRGGRLRAGEIVLTGSLVKAMPIDRGDEAVCTVEGLGEARLTLV